MPTSPAPDIRPSWPWLLALAAPFVLCSAVLLATGRVLPVFWGGDEYTFHWPLTLWFAERLPRFDPNYTESATTPLLHLLGACAVRLFGPSLPLMRALDAAFSLAGVLALFGTLRRTLRHDAASAALLSAVYGSSCYFFGYSFRWLTDNLALTGCILALGWLLRVADPAEPRPLRAYLVGCLWCALTIFTRQTYLFLGLPFALTLLLSGLKPGAMAAGLGGLALALVPFAALAAAWHGLVPPAVQARHAGAGVNLYPMELPLMLLGFYTPFFVGPSLWRQRRVFPARAYLWPGFAAAAGLAVAWWFPLVPVAGSSDAPAYFPLTARTDVPGYFAGWIYSVAAHLPRLHGNSLLFWVLLPTGLAAAAAFLRDATRPGTDPPRQVAALFLLGLLVSSTLNAICAQKYYDAPVLLFLVWQARGEPARDPWRRALLGALILLFGVYFVAYVATYQPPPATGVSPP